MATDDDHGMEGLDCDEQLQYPKSDEDIGECKLSELEQGGELRESEAAGVPVDGEVVLSITISRKYVSRHCMAGVAHQDATQTSIIWNAMPTTIQDARSA